MKPYWNHLIYVLRHKWFVFLECRKRGITLLGIIHDVSRFLPDEFIPYSQSAPYSKGNKPAAIANAFEQAWNAHQHRNKHHWEYWVHFDYHSHEMRVLPMPDQYRREMLSDWHGAGRAKGTPDVRGWYAKNKDTMLLHPETRQWIEQQLELIA